MTDVRRIAATCLALLLMLGLAACGEAPNPFRGASGATRNNPLLDVPTAVGIAVLPLHGAAMPFGRQVTEAVATRLQALEIPAEAVDSNAGLGFTLQGESANVVASPSGTTFTVVWTLRARHGAVTGTYDQSITVPSAAWTDGDAAAATRIGTEAGNAVAHMIGGDEPVRAAAVRGKYPRVSIKALENAPGDGGISLRLALIQIMFEKGVRSDDINPEVILTSAITSTPFGEDRQKVQIVWKAATRDGRDLGTVKLDNTIPNGALDGPWGPTAFAVANAAIGDLLTLLTVTPKEPPPAAP